MNTLCEPQWAPAVQANADGGIQLAASHSASNPNHGGNFSSTIEPAIKVHLAYDHMSLPVVHTSQLKVNKTQDLEQPRDSEVCHVAVAEASNMQMG